MMHNFMEALGRNLTVRKGDTIAIIISLFVAIFFVFMILEMMFWTGLMGLIPSVLIVGYPAYKASGLAWFWGKTVTVAAQDESQAVAGTAPLTDDDVVQDEAYDRQPEPLLDGAVQPRETPKGTTLFQHDAQKAVLEVKAAIRFWSWFLPSFFTVIAVLGSPVGASMGFGVYANTSNNFRLDPVSYTMWGAIYWVLIFIGLSLLSYLMTRPKVRVVALRDSVTIGDYKFDRRYGNNLRIGYKTDAIDLPQTLLQPKFGVVALRFEYGQWGEDMKYLVDAYHANEIVVWMNSIIDTVGEQEKSKYDPYVGRKIELL